MHFARWIQTIYWRKKKKKKKKKYFYRRISSCGSITCSFREDLLRICVFPSHLWVSDITELIKQLLKLYEGLTERYRERINWLEEDCNDNSFRCQPVPVDEGCNARSRARPRFRVSKSQIKGLRDLGFKWSKIAAMIGVSRITLHRRVRELGLEEETRYSEIDGQDITVPKLKMRRKNTNSRQVLSERTSNRPATAYFSVKIVCFISS